MWAQRLAIAGGIALVVFALYAAQVVLVPIALALLLSFLLTPVCNRLEHLRIPRGVAVVMTMLLVVGVLGGLLYMTYGGLDRILEQRSAYRDAIVQKVQTLGGGGMLKKLEEAEQAVEDVSAAVQGAPTEPSTQPADPATTQPEVDHGETGLLQIGGLTDAVDDVGQRVEDVEQTVDALGTANNPVVTEPLPASAGMVEQLSSVLGIVTEPVGTLGLTSVFALFILLERDRLRDKVLRLASGGKLNIATQALEEAGSRISRYLLAQAIVNGSYGIVVGIGLNVISFVLTGAAFPSWPLWVVLCITLRFIPYVGPIVGGLLPMMVALGEYEGFGVFLWVALMFIVVEIWSNQLMEPWLYGSSTGISPVGVIAAATFWVWLWGIEGLILSTPLTVCLFVLGKYAPPLKFFDILLR
ncbi:MAG: AI-2E family transporter, partial [Planctomycetota bacterium]